jgi:hypothetical protein
LKIHLSESTIASVGHLVQSSGTKSISTVQILTFIIPAKFGYYWPCICRNILIGRFSKILFSETTRPNILKLYRIAHSNDLYKWSTICATQVATWAFAAAQSCLNPIRKHILAYISEAPRSLNRSPVSCSFSRVELWKFTYHNLR